MKRIMFAAILISSSFAQAKGYGLLGANFAAPTIAGKDNVFGPVVGEIIYDSTDETFYGLRHTQGWIALSGGSSSAAAPVGSILTFAGTTCPTGYLPANGAAVDRIEYKALFGVIGTTHGYGDNSSTFNVPDYRGRFLRGVDGTAGNEPSADKAARTAMNTGGQSGNAVGSVQGYQVQSHTHTMTSYPSQGLTSNVFNIPGSGGSSTFTSNPTGGSETRPVNAYVNFCIKY